MYVTFACLRSAGGDRLEYSLAGHPPIFAMFPAMNFQSAMITIAPDDLLAVVSDGFLEITNAEGEEFGTGAQERLVAWSATEPLPQIVDRPVAETARFGSQQDDQTILLVRAWACDFLTLLDASSRALRASNTVVAAACRCTPY
jgi:serine phosphatase RsbU (regulator of sigma subunit)